MKHSIYLLPVLLIGLASPLLAFDDVIGIYTDPTATSDEKFSTTPLSGFPVFIVLSNPSDPDGLYGCEFRVETSSNVSVTWNYAIPGTILHPLPDYCFLFDDPVPPADTIVLATGIASWDPATGPGRISIHPTSPSSMNPAAPIYMPGDIDRLYDYVPMTPFAPAPSNVVFRFLPGEDIAAFLGNLYTPYSSIGRALAHAEDGQTIYVRTAFEHLEHSDANAGIAEFPLFIQGISDLTIEGLGGRATINAQGQGSCMSAHASPGLTLRTLSFVNGDANATMSLVGGGIFAYQCNDLTLDDCNFENNDASWGGGVYLRECDTYIANGHIEGNNAISQGGGLYVYDGFLSLAGTTFQQNTSTNDGGAVHVDGSAHAELRAGSMFQCSAANGGGIYVTGSAWASLCDSWYFLGCSASGGGADGWIEGSLPEVLIVNSAYTAGRWGGDQAPNVVPSGECPPYWVEYEDAPLHISVCNFPNGEGQRFSEGWVAPDPPYMPYPADAGITVGGLGDGMAADRIRLVPPALSNFFACPAEPLTPDGPSDGSGRASYDDPLCAGGFTILPCTIEVDGVEVTAGDQPLHIYFNSPDITGDGNVGLGDYVYFIQDFHPHYAYRSDFHYDRVIDLSDLVIFAAAFGQKCCQ